MGKNEVDMFKEMLKLQKEFQDKYGFKVTPSQWATAMSAECLELWGACGGKWWKTKVKTREEQLEELVDIWHFFMGFMLNVGITPEEFFEAYKKKLAENYARQKRGY